MIEGSLQLVEEGGWMGKSGEGPSKRFGGEGRKEGVVGEVVHLGCFFTCENFFFFKCAIRNQQRGAEGEMGRGLGRQGLGEQRHWDCVWLGAETETLLKLQMRTHPRSWGLLPNQRQAEGTTAEERGWGGWQSRWAARSAQPNCRRPLWERLWALVQRSLQRPAVRTRVQNQ